MKRLSAFFAFVVAVACSSEANESKPLTVAHDVVAACSVRAGWNHTSSSTCAACKEVIRLPACACRDDPAGGACFVQAGDRARNCESSIDSCVLKCAETDCTCINLCYAGKDTCRSLAGALDACLVETCHTRCE